MPFLMKIVHNIKAFINKMGSFYDTFDDKIMSKTFKAGTTKTAASRSTTTTTSRLEQQLKQHDCEAIAVVKQYIRNQQHDDDNDANSTIEIDHIAEYLSIVAPVAAANGQEERSALVHNEPGQRDL